MSWRETFYTKSDAAPEQFSVVVVDEPINRRVFTVGAQAVGPVFVKVWDTPDSGYAERFKHIIEPRFNVQRTSPIGNFDRIVQTDGIDGIRRRRDQRRLQPQQPVLREAPDHGRRVAQAEEILAIDVSQTYSTDALQAQYDRQYSSTFAGAPPNHFTPARLNVRVRPAQPFSANVGAEYDTQFLEFRDFSVSGNYNWTGRLQSSLGWSKRFFIAELPGYNDPNYRSNYLNGAVNARARDSRVGAIYDFYYNIADSLMQRQILSAYYNAQCCGIAFRVPPHQLPAELLRARGPAVLPLVHPRRPGRRSRRSAARWRECRGSGPSRPRDRRDRWSSDGRSAELKGPAPHADARRRHRRSRVRRRPPPRASGR